MKQDETRPPFVIGPLGEQLTYAMLPPANTSRWTARLKGEVVAAVEGGLMSHAEASDRYSISLEEFVGWQRAVERAGLAGLRVTRVQHYRAQWERRGW